MGLPSEHGARAAGADAAAVAHAAEAELAQRGQERPGRVGLMVSRRSSAAGAA